MFISHKSTVPPKYMFILGNNVVTANDTTFYEGYIEGYSDFQKFFSKAPLSDKDVCQNLITSITNPRFLSTRQAGYATGFIAALLENAPEIQVIAIQIETKQ
jgi:hypothetical protein